MKHSETYLLLAILVMALILFARPRVYSGPGKARLKSAFSDVNGGLKIALQFFKNDCGRFPTEAEGLKVLVEPPADGSLTNWHGPYLEPPGPMDPWGHEYVYHFPAVHSTNSYDLYSKGPDGISNTEDDIGNWQLSSH